MLTPRDKTVQRDSRRQERKYEHETFKHEKCVNWCGQFGATQRFIFCFCLGMDWVHKRSQPRGKVCCAFDLFWSLSLNVEMLRRSFPTSRCWWNSSCLKRWALDKFSVSRRAEFKKIVRKGCLMSCVGRASCSQVPLASAWSRPRGCSSPNYHSRVSLLWL